MFNDRHYLTSPNICSIWVPITEIDSDIRLTVKVVVQSHHEGRCEGDCFTSLRKSQWRLLEMSLCNDTVKVIVKVTPSITVKVIVKVTSNITVKVIVKVTPNITVKVIVKVTPSITVKVIVKVTPNITVKVIVKVTPNITVKVIVKVTPNITVKRSW
ncbi:uncharacterized protein LOC121426294 isoform X3 [Lytechinus variegatus]|uniref:uncharacterized protein LOC121426294 isoform X3 n=1 Tax=Lytechinus variegatus TaxID=7654 RepID=UPI001BB21905|nr:uncharacterized protein LOC121426294 isoform X3 [Lytechinus variegatus]